jgi:glycosyltransferase involved in cell wall biosynthesis
MIVGYLMNTYPLISTTFIGREIGALERQGLEVRRYAIRPWNGALVDPGDKAEQARTQYLLGDKPRVAGSMIRAMVRTPMLFARALAMTLRLIRNARGGFVRHFAYLAEATVLRALAERDGITHIHAHFSTNATAVAMLALQLGGPEYSFTVHGPDELLTPVENSTAEKVARARFVVCISHFARSQVMLFSDQQHWDKLTIVHCGVIPANYGRRPRGPYGKRLLFIGRLAAVKGVPLLLQAVAAVKARHPDLTLTIVGDGPDRSRLEAQAAKLGLSGTASFVGYQAQHAVAELLETSDALVLPSFAEGVPVVLMEAMASRVPVIASRVAGIPELVEDGVSGYVVPPGDVTTLIARLDLLLSDADLRARMGLAGRRKVDSDFDVDGEARRLAECLGSGAPADPQQSAPAARLGEVVR